MFRFLSLALAILLIAVPEVYAADEPIDQPDLVSFGVAYMNFDKSQSKRATPDFRVEYRWGESILPDLIPALKVLDPYLQFHPFVGLEGTALAQGYGLGGFAADWYISKHWIFTWSEGAGLYENGYAVRLGSFIEFRSEAEVGWRFDNDVRLTFQVDHISNAKLTRFNPGAETAGLYLHIPFENMFGK